MWPDLAAHPGFLRLAVGGLISFLVVAGVLVYLHLKNMELQVENIRLQERIIELLGGRGG